MQLGSALPRIQEVVGTGTKTSKAEEEMSPRTKALLCDEGDNTFTQTSLLSARHAEMVHDQDSKQTREKMRKYGTEMKSSSAFMERENSVLSELTKNLRKIAARTCRNTRALTASFFSPSLQVGRVSVNTMANYFHFSLTLLRGK